MKPRPCPYGPSRVSCDTVEALIAGETQPYAEPAPRTRWQRFRAWLGRIRA